MYSTAWKEISLIVCQRSALFYTILNVQEKEKCTKTKGGGEYFSPNYIALFFINRGAAVSGSISSNTTADTLFMNTTIVEDEIQSDTQVK